MPGWQKVLPDDDIRAVVGYVKAFSPRFAAEAPQPIAIGAPVPTAPESVTRGAAVYEKLQCGKCHGTDGRGTDAAATEFEDDWRQPLIGLRPDRAVDVPRRLDVGRDLHAISRRHVGHADAVVQGRRERRRDVGPRELCGLARRENPSGK